MRVACSWFAAAINELRLYCFSGGSVFGTSVEYFHLYSRVWVEEQGEMPNNAGHHSLFMIKKLLV